MTLQFCTEMVLPKDIVTTTKLRYMNKNSDQYKRLKAIYFESKLWKPGTELFIKFLPTPNGKGIGNTSEIQSKIKEIVKKYYQPIVNLKFTFLENNNPTKAQIRILFDKTGGSSSYIGTDCLGGRQDQPTMRFAWYDVPVVLHEFGHALGLCHEHLSPFNNPINWNLPKLYDYYKKTNGWNPATVDNNVVNRYSVNQINGSEYDNKSIMRYYVPKSLTIDGKEFPENKRLSQLDVLYLNNKYPGGNTIKPDTFYYKVYGEHITQCLKGQYNSGSPNYESTTCPEGYYCQNCKKITCPAGSYCPVKTISPIDCPAGSYCTAGSKEPTICPIGSYCPIKSPNHIICATSLSCPSIGYSLPKFGDNNLVPNYNGYAYYFNDINKSVIKLNIKTGFTTSKIYSNIDRLDVIGDCVYLIKDGINFNDNIYFKDASNDNTINFKELRRKVWVITDIVILGPGVNDTNLKKYTIYDNKGSDSIGDYVWKVIGVNIGCTPTSTDTPFNINTGLKREKVYLAVKYSIVNPVSTTNVLTQLKASHFAHRNNKECPGREIRSDGTAAGYDGYLTGTAGRGDCWYVGSCKTFSPINKITEFISSISLMQGKLKNLLKNIQTVNYTDSDGINTKVQLNTLEDPIVDIRQDCGGFDLYLLYGKNSVFK